MNKNLARKKVWLEKGLKEGKNGKKSTLFSPSVWFRFQPRGFHSSISFRSALPTEAGVTRRVLQKSSLRASRSVWDSGRAVKWRSKSVEINPFCHFFSRHRLDIFWSLANHARWLADKKQHHVFYRETEIDTTTAAIYILKKMKSLHPISNTTTPPPWLPCYFTYLDAKTGENGMIPFLWIIKREKGGKMEIYDI